MNIAKPITKEECTALAHLYENILQSMHAHKVKDNYYIWESLKAYFQSREPKFEHKHFSNVSTPYTSLTGGIK